MTILMMKGFLHWNAKPHTVRHWTEDRARWAGPGVDRGPGTGPLAGTEGDRGPWTGPLAGTEADRGPYAVAVRRTDLAGRCQKSQIS